MRTFLVTTETGFAGCVHKETVEIDDYTDSEIEDILKDIAMEKIEWSYEEIL